MFSFQTEKKMIFSEFENDNLEIINFCLQRISQSESAISKRR